MFLSHGLVMLLMSKIYAMCASINKASMYVCIKTGENIMVITCKKLRTQIEKL